MEISWGTERTGWRPYHPWSLFDQPAAAISLCSSPITNVDFCIWKEYFPKDRRPIFRSGGCNLWDILLLGSATKLGRSGYLLAYGKLGTDERSALLYPQLSTSATQSTVVALPSFWQAKKGWSLHKICSTGCCKRYGPYLKSPDRIGHGEE